MWARRALPLGLSVLPIGTQLQATRTMLLHLVVAFLEEALAVLVVVVVVMRGDPMAQVVVWALVDRY
jgi:hypothetical protein